MDKVKQLRKVRRGLFTKFCSSIELRLKEETMNLVQLKVNLDLLTEKYDELKELNTQFLELITVGETEDSVLEKEFEDCDFYDASYKVIAQKINNVLCMQDTKVEDNVSSLSVVNNNDRCTRSNIKMPKLELRKFNGDPREWVQFWGQFSKIDRDVTIESADKLQYLIQSTVVGSRARTIVESYPPCGENYHKIIDALKARFGRKDLLTEIYTRELIAVVLQKSKYNTLSTLYDKLESFMRALETLEVNIDGCAPFLFPLIESCLPEELLRTWQRQNAFAQQLGNDNKGDEETNLSYKAQLEKLMSFMRTEVENEEKLSIAMARLDVNNYSDGKLNKTEKKNKIVPTMRTAADLLTTQNKVLCIFCQGKHMSEDCNKALNMDYDEKIKILNGAKGCFRCLIPGHISKDCKMKSLCALCHQRHKVVICQKLNKKNETSHANRVTGAVASKEVLENNLITSVSSPLILIQTLSVYLKGDNHMRRVRVVLDTGSQNSYILKSTASELGLKPIKKETVVHSLFGGVQTDRVQHNKYRIHIESVSHTYRCNFEVLDQEQICGDISPIPVNTCIDELKRKGIFFSDTSVGPIEILIGADVLGKLLTGRKQVLNNGLVAVDTSLGWTAMGKLEQATNYVNCALLSINSTLPNLWELDVLGITDPVERLNKEEIDKAVKQHFLDTVLVNEEGRYEVCLPWRDIHASIPSNFDLAVKRLYNTMKRLKATNFTKEYEDVFQEWLDEKIIERVPQEELNHVGHYLPHRPVLKMNSTTKVRPVFDASAKIGNGLSLNDGLWKGINFIELIPVALFKFRLYRIGVIADIKRAFLQISVAEKERDFLRFLWLDQDGQLIVFRHRRVVFGVCCSPFLLGAVIDFHLEKMLENCCETGKDELEKTILILKESFYCDNCVTSMQGASELEKFIVDARWVMAQGKFDLRGWEFSMKSTSPSLDVNTNVLGITWNRYTDQISLNSEAIKNINFSSLTKRKILSIIHRIYDPGGFSCPVLIIPSLSSTAFIQVLRRFIARRGRPHIIFSDNGTNFVGTENALSQLDWNEIKEYSSVNKIKWKFIPPSAPWWGGWWERLVGLLKRMLRKVIGRASLTYVELETILCDCEAVLNSRPLSYVSEDSVDLKPLTPSMFLQDVREIGVPDLDTLDSVCLKKRVRYRNKVMSDLRLRFRNEYLGQLSLRPRARERRSITEGDVVIIGNDQNRRIDWTLGRVEKLIVGKDGEARVARVKTGSGGVVLRPLQRIYPLETEASHEEFQNHFEALGKDLSAPSEAAPPAVELELGKEKASLTTRAGRIIRKPRRFL